MVETLCIMIFNESQQIICIWIQEIIGEDAEVFRLECGYESRIKEVSVKWFNGGDSVIID